jgi:hypothetical protein
MLGRIASAILGGVLVAAGAYMLFLQLTGSETMRGFILGMGGAALLLGAYGLWSGLRLYRN